MESSIDSMHFHVLVVSSRILCFTGNAK